MILARTPTAPSPPLKLTASAAWIATFCQPGCGLAQVASTGAIALPNQGFPARFLANHFTSLKTARETADYDPNRSLTTGDANYWIGEARAALNLLQTMTVGDRRTFCNIALTGNP